MTSLTRATGQLRRRLGASRVRTDPATCAAAGFDSSKLAFPVAAVLVPRRVEDLSVALALANRYRVPVTVRAGGTSPTGSASPVRGGWVFDLSRWRRVKVDADAGLARVQAGARVAAIKQAAEARGWFYPPDPSSLKYCTIGGNIACNAGGMHAGRYGVTRDYVMALEGLLPTGEFVTWGTATRKFAAGFNLRDLWIGSEGMLGIVTAATLRLIPQPRSRWTALVAFRNERDAFQAVRGLFRLRIQPAICEFLDRETVYCASQRTGRVVFPEHPKAALLLVELAGGEAEVRSDGRSVLDWARRSGLGHRVARSRREADRLWEVRRQCSGAMFALGDAKLNEDIVVPLREFVRFGRFLEKLRAESGLAIPTFGHLGDGNLHVNIMYHQADRRECRAAERAVQRLMEKVVALGGAISGEHGIGLAKSPFLRLQHGPAEVAAMQAVKQALDPNGILNPGKIFEPFRVWEHPRVTVRLPWDRH